MYVCACKDEGERGGRRGRRREDRCLRCTECEKDERRERQMCVVERVHVRRMKGGRGSKGEDKFCSAEGVCEEDEGEAEGESGHEY